MKFRGLISAFLLAAALTGETYILLARDGFVCVYQDIYDASPIRTTEIHVASLPPADAEALARGIVVHGKDELAGILEDFGS